MSGSLANSVIARIVKQRDLMQAMTESEHLPVSGSVRTPTAMGPRVWRI